MIWIIEKRKQGNEIWVGTNKEAIFIGEGYDEKEYKRSMELAKVIEKALNEYESLNLSSHPEHDSQQDQYYSSSIQRHP